MKMKGLVVYDTSYGNTRAIAQTIADTLKETGVETDTFKVGETRRLNGKEYDLLVMGSPTRFGTMSLATKGLIRRMKTEEWMGKPFVAFDTENPENLEKKEWSAGEKIAERLREKKMNELLPVLKALVIGMKGPLKEGEIERAKNYARAIAVKMGEARVPTESH